MPDDYLNAREWLRTTIARLEQVSDKLRVDKRKKFRERALKVDMRISFLIVLERRINSWAELNRAQRRDVLCAMREFAHSSAEHRIPIEFAVARWVSVCGAETAAADILVAAAE